MSADVLMTAYEISKIQTARSKLEDPLSMSQCPWSTLEDNANEPLCSLYLSKLWKISAILAQDLIANDNTINMAQLYNEGSVQATRFSEHFDLITQISPKKSCCAAKKNIKLQNAIAFLHKQWLIFPACISWKQ